MKVYIANISLINKNPDAYIELLPPRHRARALKYTDNRQKSQLFASHFAQSFRYKHLRFFFERLLAIFGGLFFVSSCQICEIM